MVFSKIVPKITYKDQSLSKNEFNDIIEKGLNGVSNYYEEVNALLLKLEEDDTYSPIDLMDERIKLTFMVQVDKVVQYLEQLDLDVMVNLRSLVVLSLYFGFNISILDQDNYCTYDFFLRKTTRHIFFALQREMGELIFKYPNGCVFSQKHNIQYFMSAIDPTPKLTSCFFKTFAFNHLFYTYKNTTLISTQAAKYVRVHRRAVSGRTYTYQQMFYDVETRKFFGPAGYAFGEIEHVTYDQEAYSTLVMTPYYDHASDTLKREDDKKKGQVPFVVQQLPRRVSGFHIINPKQKDANMRYMNYDLEKGLAYKINLGSIAGKRLVVIHRDYFIPEGVISKAYQLFTYVAAFGSDAKCQQLIIIKTLSGRIHQDVVPYYEFFVDRLEITDPAKYTDYIFTSADVHSVDVQNMFQKQVEERMKSENITNVLAAKISEVEQMLEELNKMHASHNSNMSNTKHCAKCSTYLSKEMLSNNFLISSHVLILKELSYSMFKKGDIIANLLSTRYSDTSRNHVDDTQSCLSYTMTCQPVLKDIQYDEEYVQMPCGMIVTVYDYQVHRHTCFLPIKGRAYKYCYDVLPACKTCGRIFNTNVEARMCKKVCLKLQKRKIWEKQYKGSSSILIDATVEKSNAIMNTKGCELMLEVCKLPATVLMEMCEQKFFSPKMLRWCQTSDHENAEFILSMHDISDMGVTIEESDKYASYKRYMLYKIKYDKSPISITELFNCGMFHESITELSAYAYLIQDISMDFGCNLYDVITDSRIVKAWLTYGYVAYEIFYRVVSDFIKRNVVIVEGNGRVVAIPSYTQLTKLIRCSNATIDLSTFHSSRTNNYQKDQHVMYACGENIKFINLWKDVNDMVNDTLIVIFTNEVPDEEELELLHGHEFPGQVQFRKVILPELNSFDACRVDGWFQVIDVNA